MSDEDKPEAPIPTPAETGNRVGFWTRSILIVSLVLNLILIGAIAGAGLSHRSMPDRRAGNDAGLGLLFDALPPRDRRDLRQQMLAVYLDRSDARRAVVTDTRSLLAALRAEPFDRDVALAVLERQRGRAEAMLQTGTDAYLERLDGMTPRERRAYADALERVIRERRAAQSRE